MKDNYSECLNIGQSWENALQACAEKLPFNISRNDASDPSALDFFLQTTFDLKVRLTPFLLSHSFVGIPAEYAVPVNENKLIRYFKTETGMILFYVDYRQRFPTHGLFIISIKKAKKLYNENPQRIHKYKDRTDDTKNARASFYIDLRECEMLPLKLFNLMKGALK